MIDMLLTSIQYSPPWMPIEALCAFQALLVSLLIPVAIMILEKSPNRYDNMPKWYQHVLVSECAKPVSMALCVIFGAISLCTYDTHLPYFTFSSILVFVIANCTFVYRVCSIYIWYSENLSGAPMSDKSAINKNILKYLNQYTELTPANRDSIVRVWEQTWGSRYAYSQLTPKILRLYTKALDNISNKAILDELIHSIDGKIFTNMLPTLDPTLLPVVSQTAIIALSKRHSFASENILRALCHNSFVSERPEMVLDQIIRILRNNYPKDKRLVDKAIRVFINELFRTKLSTLKRLYIPSLQATISRKDDDYFDNIVTLSILQHTKIELYSLIGNRSSTAGDISKSDEKIIVIENIIFEGSIDKELFNTALCIERELAQGRSIDSVASHWSSCKYTFIKRDEYIYAPSISQKLISTDELHDEYIKRHNERRDYTLKMLHIIAPIFIKNTDIILESFKKIEISSIPEFICIVRNISKDKHEGDE